MKKSTSFSMVLVIAALVLTSLAIFALQIAVFRSPRDTGFYLFQDLAFLPLQIALVTVVLGKYLRDREKKDRLSKTNMLVSAFFSEAGNELIGMLLKFGKPGEGVCPYLEIKPEWSDMDFKRAAEHLRGCDIEIESTADNLAALKTLLKEKRLLLFIMLENPNLLEHETFTEMLWAVFHLTDELMAREGLGSLPDSDVRHLEYDIKRVYSSVLVQWIGYMRHIKKDYSYLFSLEARKNIFAGGGSVIVK